MGQPQLKLWSLPDQYIDFDPSPPGPPTVIPLPSFFNTGQYAHNIMYDENGDLLFFIVDENVYYNDGNLMAILRSNDNVDQGGNSMNNYVNNHTGFLYGSTEHIIVPVPGDCKKYYIIAGRHSLNVTQGQPGDPIVHYFIIDEPTNTSNILSVANSNGAYLDILDDVGSGQNRDHYLHMAVTPLRDDETRFLYIAIKEHLYKFLINDAGIYRIWDEPVCCQISARSEMELNTVFDDNGFIYKLAFSSIVDNSNPAIRSIKIFTLDDNGDIITSLNQELVLDVPSVEYVKGIEINDPFIFYTSTKPPYLYYANLSTLTPQPLTAATLGPNATADLSDFAETQIELGHDGKLYYAAQDRLAYLSFPGPNATWNDQGITGLNIPKSYGEWSSNSEHGIRILPDQIDGEDVKRSDAFPQTTAYAPTISANWLATFNPFGNLKTVVFHEDLTIPAGVKITIKDMVFKFKDGKGVVIERSDVSGFDGGELVLDNTVFTSFDNCGTESVMWKGVNVHGNKLASQFPNPDRVQGKLVLKNNSMIENALVAASTFNAATGNVFNYTGGIIQATQSTFRNNVQSVKMYTYDNFIPVNGQAYKDLSFFTDCTFETTRVLNDPTLFPFAFVELFEMNGINFLGNTFQNTTPLTFDLTTVINRGSGIQSLGSSFNVKALCQLSQPPVFPCEDLKSNIFSGLHYGINNSAFGGFDNMVVDNAEFIDNKSGVRLNGVNYATVTSSSFTMGPYGGVSSNPSLLPYGLYLNGCTGYKVEGNHFRTNDPGAALMLGTIVFHSGNLPNLIYKNKYENLFVNMLAEGHNRGPGPEDGLQIKCNEFFNLRGVPNTVDGWDIAVTKFGFGSTANGIAEFQGACDNTDPSSPAGNRFYFSACQFGDDANIYLNPVTYLSNMLYSHNTAFVTTPQLNCFPEQPSTPFVQLNPCAITFNESQSCPPSFRIRPILQLTQLNPGCVFINGAWTCGKIMLDYYQGKATGLIALIDGGDTQFLLNKISQGTSPGQLKNILLAESPYLSDKVLIAAIAAGLPPGILKDILIANSPLSASVLDALAGIFLPNGIANQVNAAQNGISEMAKLESRIAYNKTQRELGVNELIRHYLGNDTLTAARNKVLTLLKEESVRDSREAREHERAAANIAKEELTEAETVMSAIHQGAPPDNACKLMKLEIDLKRANKSMKNMTNTQEQMVRQVASEIQFKESARAQSMLKAGFNEVSSEIIILPVQNQLKIAYQPDEQMTNWLKENHNLINFPNPFSSHTTIETFIPDHVNRAEIVVYNLLGVAEQKYVLERGYNAITVLKNDLTGSGIYFYTLKYNGKLIEKRKMILIR
ncbi:MAG: T9SS type A sorting domain-containing protein [Flavobacteriales bacterium]|nr:T9SS type A sorting domain-containing protein [Flavobacteriales bacterium]